MPSSSPGNLPRLQKRKTGSADKIAVHDVNKCWRPPPRAPRRCTYLALVNFPVRGKCRSVQPWGATREDRMAERPRVVSTNPVKWDIYLARPAPAKLLGAVEAVSERAAIVKAAKEFKQDAAKLIAVRR